VYINRQVRALSCHATYRCHDTGACCTAGWPIHVEPDRLRLVENAVAAGVLKSPAAEPLRLRHDGHAVILPVVDGRCIFFDRQARRHCAVQHALGHDALPLACRQFPRVVVRDPLCVSVVLSHFCPTAADALTADGPVSITITAPAFPSSAEYEGLDATEGLPPLLRPEMAMDWESWHRFEELSVELLDEGQESPQEAIAQLEAAVEQLRVWRPCDGNLHDAVLAAFEHARRVRRRPHLDVSGIVRAVRDAIPPELRASADVPLTDDPAMRDGVLARFVAAHAFANWTAHLGTGLRTWLESIKAAYAVAVHTSSVRRADLMLRHLADMDQLTKAWGAAESPRAVTPPRRYRPAGRSTRS
jgi:Fe-S-cluster containining protein